MSCALSKGFGLDCKELAGGIKAIFLGTLDAFRTGVTFDGTTGDVDALPTASVYQYLAAKNTGSFEEAVNTENGGVFWGQTVNFVLQGLSSEKRKELEKVCRNRALVVFVQLQDDRILMAGRQRGLELGGSWASGTALSDLNGYTMTLVGQEPIPANHLSVTSPYTDALLVSSCFTGATVDLN